MTSPKAAGKKLQSPTPPWLVPLVRQARLVLLAQLAQTALQEQMVPLVPQDQPVLPVQLVLMERLAQPVLLELTVQQAPPDQQVRQERQVMASLEAHIPHQQALSHSRPTTDLAFQLVICEVRLAQQDQQVLQVPQVLQAQQDQQGHKALKVLKATPDQLARQVPQVPQVHPVHQARQAAPVLQVQQVRQVRQVQLEHLAGHSQA